MPLTTTGRNDLLTNGFTNFLYAGAYEDLGTTETSGGSYARQSISWAAASGGTRATNAGLTIPIAASKTIVAASIHSAVSAGNLEGWMQIGSTLHGAATVAASTDTFTTGYAHGVTTDNRVFFTAVEGAALPTGISATTIYFVLASGLTATAFKVSTSSGGAALDVTADGACSWFMTVPNVFGSAGNLTIASGQLSVDLTQL